MNLNFLHDIVTVIVFSDSKKCHNTDATVEVDTPVTSARRLSPAPIVRVLSAQRVNR